MLFGQAVNPMLAVIAAAMAAKRTGPVMPKLLAQKGQLCSVARM